MIQAWRVLLVALFLVVCHFWMIKSLAVPQEIKKRNDPRVLEARAASGDYAMRLLKQITVEPHPYYSENNLVVRQDLIKALQEIQAGLSCQGLEWVEDPVGLKVNMTQRPHQSTYHYESNNVLVRLKGKQKEALLISAHFDSVPVSFGATDNGVAVSSAMALVDALSHRVCNDPLEHDVVFNFNNGEEIQLLGSQAFTLHPWFKDIQVFVNLDGTGTAQGNRAFMFQATDPNLVEWYMKTPFPHSSIVVNHLMTIIQSDTDFRTYRNAGAKHGIDIAFYSRRYLYHTPRDNIDRIKQQSIQFLCDNVLEYILQVDQLLNQVDLEPIGTVAFDSKLDPPAMVYHDVMGKLGVAIRQYQYLVLNLLVLGITSSVWIVQRRSLWVIVASTGLVGSIFFATLVTLVWFGWLKSRWNYASTYGLTEWVLIYTPFICLLVFSLILSRLERVKGWQADSKVLATGLSGFWWMSTLFCIGMSVKTIHAFYLISTYALFSSLGHSV